MQGALLQRAHRSLDRLSAHINGDILMKCPVCGTWTIVKETRTSTGNTRRRRLECANAHRFTTIETIVTPKEKKDGKNRT